MTIEERDDHGDGGPVLRSEIEHGHVDYTAEELLEQSQLNAQAFVLGVFATLQEDPEQLQRLTEGVAGIFLRGWDAERGWEPVEILDALLTNFRSLGGEIDEYEPDQDAPNAVVVDLPSADLVEQLGVPQTAFRPMLAVSERLVGSLGCELEWSHDAAERRIRLQVNRQP
jgi:hypothetical protein